MKTVLIAHNYSKKSFAAMSYELAHYLADKGYTVIFLSHRPFFENKKVIQKKGKIIVYSWATENRPTGFTDIRHFSKIYFRHKPSVVIGHFVGSNITILVSKLLSFFRVKTYTYYHTLSKQNSTDTTDGNLKSKLYKLRKKIFYTLFVDKFICPSEMAKKDLVSFFNIRENKIKTILNALPDRYNPDKKQVKKENIVISYLGRLDESKNVSFLLGAFLEYLQLFPNSKIIVQVAGSGNKEKEIKELSKTSSKITFLGKLDYNQIDDYLYYSDFTIIPSIYDNLPTVGLESLMNGTPLLISKQTGLTYYCTENIDAYKFSPNSKNEIIDLFVKIDKEINLEMIQEMSINARQTFLKKFSLKSYNETMLNNIIYK